MLENVSSLMKTVKHKRSKGMKAVKNIVAAAVSGPSLKPGQKRRLSAEIGIKPKKLKFAEENRDKIIEGEAECCLNTKNSSYTWALSEETQQKVYEHWIKPGVSRNPGTSKSQWKKKRIGPSTYLSHCRMVLECTQHEAFLAFREENPDVQISERSFERLKPFFVTSPCKKDRETCCCKYHVELRSLFAAIQKFRNQDKERDKETYPDWDHMNELVNESMCPKEGRAYHNMKCIDRSCTECGVDSVTFTARELDKSENAPLLKYEEYVNKKFRKGFDENGNPKEVTKPVLVERKVTPGELVEKLKLKLASFTMHQFRVSWQHEQYVALKEALPLDQVLAVHDYGESWRIMQRSETQSEYFDKNEVSIHISVIDRHSTEELDGEQSTEENPKKVTEEFFCISPGVKESGPHDADAVHAARCEVNSYLTDEVKLDLKSENEFTDGCAAQYRSKHTNGDISLSKKDFGFEVTRSNQETAHAKGSHDAAGGLIKCEVEMAVLRGKATVQSAKDFYDYCVNNLQVPKGGKTKRRIFRYIDHIDRQRGRKFKPLPGILQQRFVASYGNQKVITGKLSCFTCGNCIQGKFLECLNHEYTGERKVVHCKKEKGFEDEVDEEDVEDVPPTLQELIYKDGIVAMDPGDDQDYKLFKVSSNGTTKLRKDAKCPVTNIDYAKGTKVVRGNFYDDVSTTRNKLSFKLNKKPAIIPAESVCYILTGKKGKSIKLTNDEHEEILHSMGLEGRIQAVSFKDLRMTGTL